MCDDYNMDRKSRFFVFKGNAESDSGEIEGEKNPEYLDLQI
jgi:hypothetical protein